MTQFSRLLRLLIRPVGLHPVSTVGSRQSAVATSHSDHPVCCCCGRSHSLAVLAGPSQLTSAGSFLSISVSVSVSVSVSSFMIGSDCAVDLSDPRPARRWRLRDECLYDSQHFERLEQTYFERMSFVSGVDRIFLVNFNSAMHNWSDC